MHDNEQPIRLTEAEERRWLEITGDLHGLPSPDDNALVRFMKRRPVLGMFLATAVAMGGVAGLVRSANSMEDPGFTPAQKMVLADAKYLRRLGLCEPILRDAANDYQNAQYNNEKALQLRQSMPVAEAADIACIATAQSVTIALDGQNVSVSAVELVGNRAPVIDPAAVSPGLGN